MFRNKGGHARAAFKFVKPVPGSLPVPSRLRLAGANLLPGVFPFSFLFWWAALVLGVNRIVHQYNFSSVLRPGSTDEVDVSYSDIIGFSCLNGWACGSIAATTSSVADWYWDLLGTYSILEEKTITAERYYCTFECSCLGGSGVLF